MSIQNNTKIVISKSGKNRQGHTYAKNSHGEPVTHLDKNARSWKQVVFLEDTGMKKVNGKPRLKSHTRHIPD